jgi:hypothetical protein
MRIKSVTNPHHEVISGAEKGSTLIVTDSIDLRFGFLPSLSITKRLNRGAGPKFISKATSIGVARKIMHRLGLMLPDNLIDSLQFNQQTIIDDQIRAKYPDSNPTKANRDRHLSPHRQASLRQSNPHSLPINRLKKPKPSSS